VLGLGIYRHSSKSSVVVHETSSKECTITAVEDLSSVGEIISPLWLGRVRVMVRVLTGLLPGAAAPGTFFLKIHE